MNITIAELDADIEEDKKSLGELSDKISKLLKRQTELKEKLRMAQYERCRLKQLKHGVK